MSLDSTNKSEREMRKKVSQYEAPFDPADWKAMKNTMAKQTAQVDPEKGLRGTDLLPSPSTSLFFKTIVFIGSVITLSAVLWLGNSFLGETKSSASAIESNIESKIESTKNLETQKEKSPPELEKDLGQENKSNGSVTELGLLPEAASAKEQSQKNISVVPPFSSEKQNGQKSSSKLKESTQEESNKNKTEQKTQNPNLNVGGAQTTINPFSSSSTTRNMEGAPVNNESSNVVDKTTLPATEQTIDQEEFDQNQEVPQGKIDQQNINSTKGTADPNIASNSSSIEEKERTSSKSNLEKTLSTPSINTFNRSVVGLELLDLLDLPTSILDATAELDFPELPSLAAYPDPIGSTKGKRFSLGVLAGTSYNTFGGPDASPWSTLWGLTSSYRLNNSLQVHLDLTHRYAYARQVKHLQSQATELENGINLEWAYRRSIDRIGIFETPISISYRPNTLNKFLRAFRFHVGLRPTFLLAPETTEREVILSIGSISSIAPDNWTTPAKKAGLKKADLGLLLGFDIFIRKNLYLNFSANLNFRDLTDDSFWNVDPQINNNTDFQISLRWTPLKF